jgi:hypothetical protein
VTDEEYRRLRKESFCGAKPGGSAAYYYQERCILKDQHTKLMRSNRRAASFVQQARSEVREIRQWFKDPAVVARATAQSDLAFTPTIDSVVDAATAMMVAPENMTKDTLAKRYRKAVVDASPTLQNSVHLQALIFDRVASHFALTVRSIEGFHRGEAAPPRGAK